MCKQISAQIQHESVPYVQTAVCQLHILTQTQMASNLETLTTGSPSMSCRPLTGAEAEGLASPPWSVDSPEWCEEHGESLSMFCLDDLEPLCKQCAAVSHAGHRVYLLTEAATDCKVGIRCPKTTFELN